jgi:predicted metal-dependent HD superfamily phosphohydrolase
MNTLLQRLIELAPNDVRDGLLAEDWQQLETAYRTPIRGYHNLQHIVHVAELATKVHWRHPNEVYCAVLFHDAVYMAIRKDNEEKSAALAAEVVARRFSCSVVDPLRVVKLIELTARHGTMASSDVDADEAQFLDADMSVLGAPWPRYLAYAQGVALEYSVIPKFWYRRKRRSFLKGLLERPRLFLSDTFHVSLDLQARCNIAAELAMD